MDLDISVRSDGDVAVVAATGEIDLQTAPMLTEALSEAIDSGARRVVVDLAGVGFLDSSALGALVGANKRIRDGGGLLQLVAASDKVVRLFRITRLTEVFAIYPSVDEALDAPPAGDPSVPEPPAEPAAPSGA